MLQLRHLLKRNVNVLSKYQIMWKHKNKRKTICQKLYKLKQERKILQVRYYHKKFKTMLQIVSKKKNNMCLKYKKFVLVKVNKDMR